jgi:hypothetical protein
MSDGGLSKWTSRYPEIVAWRSEKYEWAKNRAIYGTDLTSYLLTDFCMPAVEEALSHVFPVGRKANETYVKQRVDLAAPGGVPLCFDFEDFNSQHSLDSQYEVVAAFADVYCSSMHEDQREAIAWVLRSILTQRVEGVDNYRTTGTLLSGWRLTTLVNTVLNRAYLELAGCMEHVRDSVHNGDDVLAYTYSVADAVAVMDKAARYGIRAQPAKCAIGGLQEFLRVDRAATVPTGAQYLTRACATAVHARTESNVPENAISQLTAQETRLLELAARGADTQVIDRLAMRSDVMVERAFGMEKGDVAIMRSTHVAHGGLSDDPDLEPKWEIKLQASTEPGKLERCLTLPGVADYADYLVQTFKLKEDTRAQISVCVARAAAAGIELTRRASVLSLITDTTHAKHEQYIKGVCKDEYQVMAYSGRARLTGLPVGRLIMDYVTGVAGTRIMASANPLRTMALIF